jgi:hypothetical protein
MANEDKVSAAEILQSAGATRPVKGGTFLQRTGLYLAGSVGVTGAIITFALVGRWIFYAPPVPVIPPTSDPTTAKAILDNFRTLQQVALEPFASLFDSIVVKVLLPVFTSILGYIFGSKANKTEE